MHRLTALDVAQVKQLADMMVEHSRSIVCDMITKEIMNASGDNGRVLKDLTCLYAFIIAGLHAMTGVQASLC